MKKILIIEDDKNIASLERDYLEVNGYEVSVESNGNTGLKSALKNEFNLVILDIMLPGIDGFEICKTIRKEKDIPILLVSAKKEDIDKIRGLGLGADDYIVKPFSPSELVARVNAHISRFERLTANNSEDSSKSDIIETGGLVIDIKARRVFVDNNEISLANKEFDLLVFLASNPNIVYSKDTLFDKIWGFDSFGETSTVTVHINRIREKIEKDMSNPSYIETVWGAGYRFKG
ncbi:MAG: response regulator transcription factor [Ruminococcaceae bacterium]|nr:response regulator transcription factor [Oscillospiraceae bacterium]